MWKKWHSARQTAIISQILYTAQDINDTATKAIGNLPGAAIDICLILVFMCLFPEGLFVYLFTVLLHGVWVDVAKANKLYDVHGRRRRPRRRVCFASEGLEIGDRWMGGDTSKRNQDLDLRPPSSGDDRQHWCATTNNAYASGPQPYSCRAKVLIGTD